jgi:hypothetical protein
MAVRAAVDGEHGERVGDRGDEQDEQVGDGGDSSQCTDHGSGDDSVRALCDGARNQELWALPSCSLAIAHATVRLQIGRNTSQNVTLMLRPLLFH